MSLFDLSGAVALMSDQSGTVTRIARAVGTNGKPLAPAVTATFAVSGSFQPVSNRLDRAAYGFSETDVLWDFFSSVVLLQRDVLTFGSKTYEVERVGAWNNVGNFFEVMVRERDAEET